MYRRISLRHNERSRRGGDRGREGISALRRARLSKKRFALLLGLFLLALFPNSGPPAIAAPRASGEIVAHEVSIPLPAVNAPLTRQGGGTLNGADAGQTGGAAKDVARSFTEPATAGAAAINPTRILTRQDWAADDKLMQWIPRYPQKVQKAVVHHTVTDDGGNGQVAATIRAIYYYHAVTRGWGDIGYSYLVDKYGNVWTGRQGGDNTEGGHAYGWNKGSIGIAAIGTYSVTAPTPAMVASIANLIAEKFTQFGVQPYGADPFVHQEQAPDGTWVNVTSNPPNVQGHRDCNYIQSQYGGQTACPGNALYAQLVNIRQMAQAAVVNGYNQMPYIETALPKAGYPGANIAVGVTVSNRGKTTIPGGTRVSYRVMQGATTVIAQGGAGTIPSDIVPGGIAGLNVPFTVPAIGNYIVRWDLQNGSTWWNPLYGSPVREQYFRGADWSVDWVSDNVPISWTAGETKMTSVPLANDGS